jgi:hypothetical protein
MARPNEDSVRKAVRSEELPRRMTLLLDIENNNDPQEITKEEFLQYCKDDAERLYDMVNLISSEYQNVCQQLRNDIATVETDTSEEITQLKASIKSKDIAILELTEERDQYRDAFAQQALQYRNCSESSTIQCKKSSKIPDPPILTDGKEPTFEDWLLRMEDKLSANADHYPTSALRLAYVKSRCGGRASDHIISRSRSDAINKYQDSADIFEHLKTVFLDVNRVLNAKGKYRRLYMKTFDKFQDFLSEFSYLAQESNLAKSEWKEELYYKLHSSIQRLVIKESNDPTIDFSAFAIVCTQTANRLEMISSQEQRFKERSQSQSQSNPHKVTTSMANSQVTTTRNPSIGKSGYLTIEARTELMKEGRCFYCKEAGHISQNCFAKKRAIELKTLTLSDKVSVDAGVSESGKEDP